MDKRALKILFDTYWSSQGWREESKRKVSPEDFAYAKSAGIMFDPVKLDHEEVLKRLFKARDNIESRQVTDAFLASLSTRRLDLRSTLGSFALFRRLQDHAPVRFEKLCGVCGQYLKSCTDDLSVFNFERHKWGGVRHDIPPYAMFDLELFLKETTLTPTQEDIDIFRNLISAINAAPDGTTSATLQILWTDVFRSNKDERATIIDIFGYCGILQTRDHEGYRNRFIPLSERDLPNRRSVDRAYPICWWSQADGINVDALNDWFGYVL